MSTSAMSDNPVRTLGAVVDDSGFRCTVGVDGGTVTVGGGAGATPVRFTQQQAEEFGRLFIAACWQAAAQAVKLAEDEEATEAVGRAWMFGE